MNRPRCPVCETHFVDEEFKICKRCSPFYCESVGCGVQTTHARRPFGTELEAYCLDCYADWEQSLSLSYPPSSKNRCKGCHTTFTGWDKYDFCLNCSFKLKQAICIKCKQPVFEDINSSYTNQGFCETCAANDYRYHNRYGMTDAYGPESGFKVCSKCYRNLIDEHDPIGVCETCKEENNLHALSRLKNKAKNWRM